ncbi:hypothetical protein L2E82_50700 [Cichorium intybus]|nr:hypothetical protein L2E82_50700 [Cichorium intybus]
MGGNDIVGEANDDDEVKNETNIDNDTTYENRKSDDDKVVDERVEKPVLEYVVNLVEENTNRGLLVKHTDDDDVGLGDE